MLFGLAECLCHLFPSEDLKVIYVQQLLYAKDKWISTRSHNLLGNCLSLMLEKLQNKKETKETDKKAFVFWKRDGLGRGGNVECLGLFCQEFAFLFLYPL